MSHARSAAAHFANALRALSVPETPDDPIGGILARLEADADEHLEGPRATGEEIGRVESALGRLLPSDVHRLLVRFGGSILYDRHEIFGPQPLFIHDIVMVPDMLTMRAALARERRPLGELVPVHRADGITHLLDLAHAGEASCPVVSLDGSKRYESLAEFLLAVVVPQVTTH